MFSLVHWIHITSFNLTWCCGEKKRETRSVCTVKWVFFFLTSQPFFFPISFRNSPRMNFDPVWWLTGGFVQPLRSHESSRQTWNVSECIQHIRQNATDCTGFWHTGNCFFLILFFYFYTFHEYFVSLSHNTLDKILMSANKCFYQRSL